MTATATWTTAAAGETEALGEALAPALAPGDLVALVGPLGAGKTRLVAGVARGVAAAARVRSPTFTLVNEYAGRILVVHLDLFRVSAAEADGLGLDEYLERGVVLVEWGEKLPASLARAVLRVDIAMRGGDRRELTATASEARGRELLAAWRAAAVAR